MKKTIYILGGGAAGFFSALSSKFHAPDAQVTILEGSAKVLSKVRISGGGRCNVTHSCFDPKNLISHYPRGGRELLGPFHTFQPQDMIEWLHKKGVELKTELDGRMFPITDSSETIIECFLQEANRLGVEVRTRAKVTKIEKHSNQWHLLLNDQVLIGDKVIFATGSSIEAWKMIASLGHTVIPPVPSLFTLNIKKFPLISLAGVSSRVQIKLLGTKFSQAGPLLITHWGFSGPAPLKLSAFAARYLAEKEYRVPVLVDWLPDEHEEKLCHTFEREKELHPKKHFGNLQIGNLPKNLWKELASRVASLTKPLQEISKRDLRRFVEYLKRDEYLIEGKTTNKEEFVTCGGVKLSEVHFKTMESKLHKGLYFCGEVLDIDGVTGGFNFQCAWTTGWLAGRELERAV